jgi:hypothetical protein
MQTADFFGSAKQNGFGVSGAISQTAIQVKND